MLNKKVDFPDKLLIKGLKKKSHKTFEIIFNHYYEKLYRLAFAYLMNQDLAEDTGNFYLFVEYCRFLA